MPADSNSGARGRSRIVMVDDHPLFREGAMHLINRQPDLAVVDCAESVQEAKVAIEKHHPDLLLLDLRLIGGGDTLDFIKQVRASHPEIRVLVLSQHDELTFAERCLRAGADGYVSKNEAGAEIIAAIHAVLRGETYLSRKVAVLVFHRAVKTGTTRETSGIKSLTDRQLHVFQLIGAGLSNSDIAKAMNLSVNTVETHREHIKEKLGARDAAEVARLAEQWARGEA